MRKLLCFVFLNYKCILEYSKNIDSIPDSNLLEIADDIMENYPNLMFYIELTKEDVKTGYSYSVYKFSEGEVKSQYTSFPFNFSNNLMETIKNIKENFQLDDNEVYFLNNVTKGYI